MDETKTIELPGLMRIRVSKRFGFVPFARFLRGSVVISNHWGPGAEKRAWRSYHRYEEPAKSEVNA